jgi:hypothetical protein
VASAKAIKTIPTVDELLSTASKIAGLTDFGEREFVGSLTVLTDSLRDEARLNARGVSWTTDGLLRMLINRLRYQRDVAAHPEILDEVIRTPIVILGLPRTGTTKLQRALSAGPGVQRIEYWRLLNPAPFDDEIPGKPAARIRSAELVEKALATQFPDFMARHPLEAREPEEELTMMEMSFETIMSWLFTRTPSFYRYIAQRDPSNSYRLLLEMLQYLQWQDGGGRDRPWILKSPVHIGALETLIRTFPDAVIVHCHRDPSRVIPSFATLMEAGRRIRSDVVEPTDCGRDVLEFWGDQIDHNLRARAELPDAAILDVRFESICDDLVSTISDIYDHAGLRVTPEAVSAWKGYDERRPEGHFGSYSYSPEQYGLTTHAIDARFSQYRNQFLAN